MSPEPPGERENPQLLFMRVQKIVETQGAVFHQFLYILENIQPCPNWGTGHFEVIASMVNHWYDQVRDKVERKGGCQYALTCDPGKMHGCSLGSYKKAKVLPFHS